MAKDFTFKKFHINAYKCGMPVSTDAVLLGAWANIERASTILDIGAGTGILSIMCAQRNATANITAVEIEEHAFNAAQLNIKNCPWSDRLSITHTAIEDYAETSHPVDMIICNPPYFNEGEVSSNKQRAAARHTASLSHVQLIMLCVCLLTEQGSAHFILPKEEALALIDNIDKLDQITDFQLSKLTYVKTTVNKEPTRVLIEFTKSVVPLLCVTDEIIIHDGLDYSKDFIALTQAFYLKM